MAEFQWLTLQQAITALQARLNAGFFWTTTELQTYIFEALRIRSCLCEEWKTDFSFPAQGCQWINTGTAAGSPRLRTITDVELYTQMQLMLLEPPSGGGTWTGTNQFSLQKLQYALSNRRNEVIQATACNLTKLDPIVAGVNTRRVMLPDTTLELRRVRFLMLMATPPGTATAGGNVIIIPVSTAGITKGMVVTGVGISVGTVVVNYVAGAVTLSLRTTAALNAVQVNFYYPITLTREDTQSFQDYNPGYLQEQGIPQSWSVATQMPLQFDVDRSLIQPGLMDVIVLQSGPAFNPPTPSLMGIPDDWCWVPMYGALADLLGEESESTDRQRAAYCMKRYKDGLQMMMQSNWLTQGTVNNVARATPALADKDDYAPEWEELAGLIPSVIQAGMDLVSIAPGAPCGASLTLVGNAPLLDSTGTYIQCSRDDWPSTLDYAHHLSTFKSGGFDFYQTIPMLDSFLTSCKEDNDRVLTYGILNEELNAEGQAQEKEDPR